ncbi:MAG TPA: alpha/beta hydrolase [Candidatus Avipropionibacterium avicola]|uniref:Alpha/beta hydrolase n=1 Tax=Candidatus Avipropionibacterium avicola TaxID=2840701 RepID=A0A9D1H004_9ACTN|nr:alpha/beta hydrolase [Candidatus Avipropionibacterium avicola]
MATATARSGKLESVGLHVEDTGGAGRPVVLLHGWPMSAQVWTEQVRALTGAGHRVVSYDRRGFGRSDVRGDDYGYDALADDLAAVMTELDLTEATILGFSMGGGEVARYVSRHGQQRVHSLVFAAAVPPYLLHTEDNPEGPLPREGAEQMSAGLRDDRETFFEGFTTTFFTANGELRVTDAQRQEALALCLESDQEAALACIDSFSFTDFRADLEAVTVPTLVIHGDADEIVPLEGAGQRTHAAIAGSQLVVIPNGPHGINTSHPREFNEALVSFCAN